MDAVQSFVDAVNTFVWGPVMLVLLVGTGLFLTVGLRFMTFRRIGVGFRLAFAGRTAERGEKGEITPFQALTTALSATIGTGNIAGVATAIALGGPGAVFWMWITALVGMATKYSEAVLAVKYREVDPDGRYVGGPMYYIRNGLGRGWAWLGALFAIFAAVASFGIGNAVQTGEVANAVGELSGEAWINANRWIIGLIVSTLVFSVVIGGLRRVAFVAERLVPLMAVLYILGALTIIVINIADVPAALGLIVSDAFTGTAAAGGFAGAAVMAAIRFGVARGVFSNEAGLGSAAIAHAAARTNDPVRQGTVAMLGTFIDTLIVCTMTALVILTARIDTTVEMVQVLETPEAAVVETAWVCPDPNQAFALAERGSEALSRLPFGDQVMAVQSVPITRTWQSCDSGSALSLASFNAGIPGASYIVIVGLMVFAFTTILGWSVYGERAAEYLFGPKVVIPFRILWSFMPFIATLIDLPLIWDISDTMNAMMAIPNLIALLLLSGTVFAVTRAALSKGGN